MPQYELNLRDYWQVIQKRRLTLVVIFLATLFFTITYTNLQKPVYRATASVQWIEHRTVAALLTDIVQQTRGDPLIAQAKIITSLPILERAVIESGLAGKYPSPDEITAKAAALQGAVSARPAENTNIIYISVMHGDPQLAANIANKVAEAYIVENFKEKSKQSRIVREFIEKRLEEVTTRLKNAEEKLAKFKETESPSGVAVSLQKNLADLESERQRLFQKYTAMHPDIKSIDERIEQLKEQMKRLPQKELGFSRLNREVEINTRLYSDFKQKLESARISVAEKIENVNLIDRAVPPGAPISPNKRLNYILGALGGLMLGLSGAFLIEQLDTSIGTIEDVENYLKIPVLGVIPYLKPEAGKKAGLMQRLWPRKVKGEDRYLRLRNQLLTHYSSSSAVFEAYRILRTNIQTQVFKEKIQRKIILFTSSGAEEGKSITISNLAIAMAQGGLRTLLIDGDMRRATLHKIFGMKNEPGLSNVLGGTIDSKDAIRTLADILTGEMGFDEALNIPGLDNLNILVSGSIPVNSVELLASPEMAALLAKLRDSYDIILIDSPPALVVADATILAPKVDGVILVYRVGKVPKALIYRAKTQLIESGAQVKGIVLNNISPQLEMRYGYNYYYQGYGKYYTSEEKAKKSL